MLALTLWAVAKAVLTLGRYFNQDEFEYLHQGWLLHSGKLQYLDFSSNHPPFFFELLSRLNLFFHDPVQLLWAGRAITLVSSGVQLLLVWAISRTVFGPRAARWTLIVYATAATFLEWSTEIRSDALMVPLWLAAVHLLLSGTRMRGAIRLFAIGLFLGSAFWTNQKVAYLALPVCLLLVVGLEHHRWARRDLGWAALGALLPTAVCFGSAALAGNLSELLQHNFAGAAELAASDPYGHFRPMVLYHLLTRDPGLVTLALVASAWMLARWRDQRRSVRFVLLASWWGAGSFFLTPGPFHYYLLSVLPMFAVGIGGFLGEWRWLRSRAWLGAALLALLLVAPVLRLARFATPTNELQLKVIRLGSALTDDRSPVFDGTGILVDRPDAYGFHWVLWAPEVTRYRRGELPRIEPAVRAGGGRLVILTYRVLALPERDVRELLQQFPRLWGPLCVPGFDSSLRGEDGRREIGFELWYEGEYEVFPAGARIDGRVVEGVTHLSAGYHVALLPEGAGRVVVRDATYRSLPPLPAEPSDWRVFGNYGYSY